MYLGVQVKLSHKFGALHMKDTRRKMTVVSKPPPSRTLLTDAKTLKVSPNVCLTHLSQFNESAALRASEWWFASLIHLC
jgi:hypothetical protein